MLEKLTLKRIATKKTLYLLRQASTNVFKRQEGRRNVGKAKIRGKAGIPRRKELRE